MTKYDRNISENVSYSVLWPMFLLNDAWVSGRIITKIKIRPHAGPLFYPIIEVKKKIFTKIVVYTNPCQNVYITGRVRLSYENSQHTFRSFDVIVFGFKLSHDFSLDSSCTFCTCNLLHNVECTNYRFIIPKNETNLNREILSIS